MGHLGWRIRVFACVFALAVAMGDTLLPASNSSRLVVRHLRSERLSHSLVGTDPVREVAVYLPPGYDESSAQRYPVIYFLPNPFERKLNEFGIAHGAEEYTGPFDDSNWGNEGRIITEVLPFFRTQMVFAAPGTRSGDVPTATGSKER